MEKTVVSNRSMILLAVAARWATSLHFDRMAFAAHNGDHNVYPDCRVDFVDSMRTSLALADWHSLDLNTPFASMSSAALVARGADQGVDLDATWSCYEGGDVHYGFCETCLEQRDSSFFGRRF